MPAVPHLVIAALLVTLAAGSAAIFAIERILRERSPKLFRAVVGHLVLFNLLTAVGLGYRLVEQNSATTAWTVRDVHLLSAHLLVLAILKVVWLRSFAAIAWTLARRAPSPRANMVTAIGASVAALAALAGWLAAVWTGHLSTGLVLGLVTDVAIFGGMSVVAVRLWRASTLASGAAELGAMRWFSAGTLAIVLTVALSFVAGAAWASWRGAVQSLAHTLVLLVYEALLVAWAARWGDAWAAENWSGADPDAAFDLAADRHGLSKREREVAALLCRGRTNQEIADTLFVALQTIKDHNYRIFQKVGVRNRTELTRRFTARDPEHAGRPHPSANVQP
jgi:DNA-binding CsgD family transcriptional regulator